MSASRAPAAGLPPFQRLLDEHGSALYRYLRVAAGAEADDCFQETVLAALRAYPRLPRNDNLRGWLFVIARRKVLDLHRRRATEAVPVAAIREDGHTAPGLDGDPGLWDAVGRLPAGQRDAVILRYVVDLPYRDIGRVLHCTEEAGRQRVHAGLRTLRREWTG